MAKELIADPIGESAFTGTDEVDNFFPALTERAPIEDPTMDPGSPRWQPRKYFAAQPKITIVMPRDASDLLGDPSRKIPVKVPVSINGFKLMIQKDKPTAVPRDFALHIVDIKAGYMYGDVEDPLGI